MKHVAIALALLLPTSGRAAAAPTRDIDVAVAASDSVSDIVLNEIFTEAGAIWDPADVTFHWHRSSASEASRPDSLLLMFEPPAAQPRDSQAPLGWLTFAMGRPGHTIHLAPANAESLIHRTPTAHDRTLAEHDVLLGRALGRAFAHEAGHYLLRSKAHSAHGLMRAAWPAEEFLGADRARFAPSADEQAAARWTASAWSSGEEE